MKGTRSLTNAEIALVAQAFEGTYAIRNRSLFMLGVSCGGRISELLSLKVSDVYQNSKPVTDLVFDKSIVKGKDQSRAVPLNTDGRDAIDELIYWMLSSLGNMDEFREYPIFPSRNGGGIRSMTRKAAADVLKAAFEKAGLNGKLATHSLRKSYAQRLYEQTSDIYVIKEMLGHRQINTTQAYLGVNIASVREASEAMSLACSEIRNTTPVFRETDEKLIFELTQRGYAIQVTKG